MTNFQLKSGTHSPHRCVCASKPLCLRSFYKRMWATWSTSLQGLWSRCNWSTVWETHSPSTQINSLTATSDRSCSNWKRPNNLLKNSIRMLKCANHWGSKVSWAVFNKLCQACWPRSTKHLPQSSRLDSHVCSISKMMTMMSYFSKLSFSKIILSL